MELLTAAQMRAIEQAAIDSGAVTGLELMERAGRGVVEAIFAEWPELQAAPHKAVVLCGPGNNGGDGFVVARLLKEWGWEVEVFLYGDPAKLPPDAKVNYGRWAGMGDVVAMTEDQIRAGAFKRADLIVDAIFGTGLTRPVPNAILRVLRLGAGAPNDGPAHGTRVVAVDMPSGLHSDTGKVICADATASAEGGGVVPAALTVSFHRAKCGHYLAQGPDVCGVVRVVPIGLAPRARDGQGRAPAPSSGVRIGAAPKGSLLRKASGHKFGYGHAVVCSGPMGRSGAARLAARGALRVGAGLVTVAAPGSAMMECATQLTAIMLRKSDGAEDLTALLQDVRLNSVCLGPGLGVGAETRHLVATALTSAGEDGPSRHSIRSVVLDADALTSFADDPQALFDLLHPDTVLTPHAGEFARLFPDIAEKLNAPATTGPAYSKVDATRAAAARAGCTILFKGPDTVIADPSGCCAINAAVYERAAPWLATAGSGDVLAGMITGLLARGLAPMQAAETAAWLHVEAARTFGPGLIAEDLPETLPRVFRDLGL